MARKKKSERRIIGADVGAGELATKVSFDAASMPRSSARAMPTRYRTGETSMGLATDGVVLARTDLTKRRWCFEIGKRPLERISMRVLRAETLQRVWDEATANANTSLAFVAHVEHEDCHVAVYRLASGKMVGFDANRIGYFANSGMTEILVDESNAGDGPAVIVRQGAKMAVLMPMIQDHLEIVFEAVRIAEWSKNRDEAAACST